MPVAEKLELSIQARIKYGSSVFEQPGWGALGSRWPSSHLNQASTVCGPPLNLKEGGRF